MKKNNFVTICIPARNAERFLGYTLNNILNNNYPSDKYEVLIGNHGSTDRTRELLLSYSHKHDNIRFFDIEFDGPNRPLARNKLIEQAKGEILIFIDQDILVSSHFIESHVELHEKYNGCIIAGYTFGKDSISNAMQFQGENPKSLNLNNISSDYDILKSQNCFKDDRENLGYIKADSDIEFENLTDTITPFKAFWLCNLSILRSDIIDFGGFDEFYKQWGMDDDDLAYRYQLNSRKMIFSRSAWAYHMPHPVNTQNQISDWRLNCEYFFKKYLTRELELFTIFKGHIDKGLDEIQLTFNSMPNGEEYNNIIKSMSLVLPPTDAERLGILIMNEESSKCLGLAQCFNPFTPLSTQSYIKDGCTYWPLIGFRTSFEKNSIDETILVADSAMFFEEYLLKILLLEIARISNKVIIFFGEAASNPKQTYLVNKLESILELVKFNSLERIYLK